MGGAFVVSVIAAQRSAIPYLSALLPSELELQTLEETDSSEQDDQTDSENTPGNIISVSPGRKYACPTIQPYFPVKMRLQLHWDSIFGLSAVSQQFQSAYQIT